jgi:hypothetical protein
MWGLLFSIALSWTLGYLLIGFLLRTPSCAYNRLLKYSLAAALGLGISSCIYFAGLLILTPSGSGLLLFDAGIHMGLIAGLALTARLPSIRHAADPPPTGPSANPVVCYIFWASLMISILTLGIMALQSPYGGQDALGIWNIRARVLYKAQDSWLEDLATIGHHPDYPLLLPSLVARSWFYFGRSAWWIPFLVQGLFLYSAISGLTALIAGLRGARQGLLAGLVLLGSPFLLRESAGLQADVAVACYFLFALALVSLKECCYPDRPGPEAAAGLMAALAAWTKNEGLLFLLVLPAVRMLTLYCRSGLKIALRSISALAMGMLPVLVLLVYFKLHIAPVNDLVAGQSGPAILDRIADPSRYSQILAAFFKGMLAFERWQAYPLLLAIYMAMAGITRRPEARFAGSTILAVILTVLCGYFCVYLATPHDLHWHLRTALHRLLLQVWPATLLMVFLLVGNKGTTSHLKKRILVPDRGGGEI